MTIYTPQLEGRTGPKYRILADAITDDIRDKVLAIGDKLPTHRDLAYRVGVTVGTITRAYQELQRRGLTSAQVGNGSYVLDSAPKTSVFTTMPPGDIRPFERPNMIDEKIDFAMNRLTPGPEDQALAHSLQQLSKAENLSKLTQYNPAPGIFEHRQAIATLLGTVGLDCAGEDIILTNGAQHAMAATALALFSSGDIILTESLTYPGITSLTSHLNVRPKPVAMDEFGMRPDALETAVRETGARVVYLVPIHQNPTTVTMNKERLEAIARIAIKHDLLIIEDDVYGFQPEQREAPLAQMIPGNTIYISGLAKSIAPGLRIGFIRAPAPLFKTLCQAMQVTGWMIPPLMGDIAAGWIMNGTAQNLIQWHRDEAKARYAMMQEILDGFVYKGAPTCLHLWLDLPKGHRSDDVIRSLRQLGIHLAAPESFIAGLTPTPHAIRLCLGSPVNREQLRTALTAVRDVLLAPPSTDNTTLDMMIM